MLLAWADIELGNETKAEAEVLRIIAYARGERIQLVLVDALRIHALLAMRRSQWAEAADALARAMPYPYAAAKALSVYGQLHMQRGEPEPARARFTAALGILDRLGERLYAEHVERALAELAEG